MTTPDLTKPALLLFIHGWWSSSTTAWGRFPQLVREDPALAARYHVADFDYPTGAFGDGVSVSQVAEYLRTKMAESRAFSSVAIIAHSLGGLVTRRYIADCFNRDGRCPVDRVLFFATPHLGAPAASVASRMPGARFVLQPQTLGLAMDSADLFALFQAEDRCAAHLRVPTRFVVAADDRWVPPLSAAGSHGLGDYLILPGETHGSLVDPPDETHVSFQIARDFLLEELSGGLVVSDHRQPLLKQKWSAEQSAAEADRDRFVYWSRSIPLIGRDDELAQIEAFLWDPSRRFSWMLLHGSGGVGKSRLALEVILAQRGGWWQAGFLDERHAGPDWTVWQPRLPTLLVIDYAASAPAQVTALIAALAEREGSHQLRQPVRLILIERQKNGPWLERILASRRSKSCRESDLALTAPSSLWPLFVHVWKWRQMDTPPLAEPETLARFAALDPQQRPLFAMLMADAIARHGSDRHWSREALLDDVLVREREKFWRPAAATSGLSPQHIEREERALALATMTDGLPSDALADDSAGLLPRWDRDRHPRLFRSMSGFAEGIIRPLEPDLVGELFVLTLLEADVDASRPLVERAWHTEPFDVATFVVRCAEDFVDHPALISSYDISPRSREARLAWGFLAFNLVERLCDSDLAAARALYDDLRALAVAHPDEAGLRAEQSRTAGVLAVSLGAGDPAAQALYEELRALANGHPGEADLQLNQARTAASLILDDSDPAVAWALYYELRALAAAHAGEAELRLRQAQAAFGLVYHLGAGDPAAARALYDELRTLATSHAGEAELRCEQAKAVCALLYHLGAGDPAAARALYDELRALANVHPGDAELRLWQAKAAASLVLHLGAGDPAATRALYDELRALAAAHPGEAKLQQVAIGNEG